MEYVFVERFKAMNEVEEKADEILMGTPLDGVPLVQLHIMAALYELDKQHASSLAKTCGRAATSFTPILDKVEQRGWIKRENDPQDRRAVFICVTPAGWKLRGLIEDAVSALNAAFGYEPILTEA